MATLKIKMTRKLTNIPWFVPSKEDVPYIRNTYPSVKIGYTLDGSFEIRREWTGDRDSLQQMYEEFYNEESVLNKRVRYCNANDITFSMAIED